MFTQRFGRAALALGLCLASAAAATATATAQEGERPREDRGRAPEARRGPQRPRPDAEQMQRRMEEQMRRRFEEMQRRGPGTMRPMPPFGPLGQVDPGRFLFRMETPGGGPLGLTLRPVPDVLRAHLDLPEGAGLVVDAIADGSPAAGVIEANDILLRVGETELSEPGDLAQALDAAEGEEISLTLLRRGEEQTVELERPKAEAEDVVEDAPAERYILGVTIETPDEAVRSQLGLPEGRGVIVMSVAPDSAAERAGLKPNDLLIALGGEPIVGARELAEQVQATNGEEVELTLIRDGEEMTVGVTADKRPAPPLPPGAPQGEDVMRFFGPGVMIDPETGAIRPGPGGRFQPEQFRGLMPPAASPEMERQIGEILEQLKQLRQEVESLKQDRPGRRGRDGA